MKYRIVHAVSDLNSLSIEYNVCRVSKTGNTNPQILSPKPRKPLSFTSRSPKSTVVTQQKQGLWGW